MSDRIRCACRSCTIRGLMWPATIISAGVLLLLGETRSDNFSIWNTYPVILIVLGAFSVAVAAAPREGHVSGAVPPTALGTPGSATTVPPNQYPGQGQGQ